MKRTILYGGCVAACLVLSGCGRLIDWAKDSVYQGEEFTTNKSIPAQYVRSTIVHDQLQTSAIFDALWLSNPIKTEFSNITALKKGKSEEMRKAFLRRQLEENKHFISFYVLCNNKLTLGEARSLWTLFLEVDGQSVVATEIKVVDLDPIYQAFFGKRFNRFKDAYRVKFDAKNSEEQPYITENTQQIKLVFRSMSKQAEFVWSVTDADREPIALATDTDQEVINQEEAT